jgi:hypothetical protein
VSLILSTAPDDRAPRHVGLRLLLQSDIGYRPNGTAIFRHAAQRRGRVIA